MTGNFINLIAILVGSAIGVFFGARLSEHLKATVISGMGLFTTAVGIQMFLKTENALIVLGALIFGAILGEWWKVEEGVQNLGIWLEKRFAGSSEGGSSRFVRGFLTASVLYCTGPMAVLGSISDGLRGELTLMRAARAAAALAGADQVTDAHLRQVAGPALRHRLRRNVLDEGGSGTRVALTLPIPKAR